MPSLLRPSSFVLVAITVAAGLAACSGGSVAPTIPMRSFATAPPLPSTLPGATTSAPAHAATTSPTSATFDAGAPAPTGASKFQIVPSTRLVDTGASDQCAGSQPAGTDLVVPLSALPAGTTAVAVNVVIREAAGAGSLSLAPGRPVASVAGRCDAVAKLVVVPTSSAASFTLTSTVAARIAVDLVGVFVSAPDGSSGGRLITSPPTRVLDTSISLGAPGPVPANGQIQVQVGGAAGVPVKGVSAVVLQVAVTDASPPGAVRLWASGGLEPAADSLLVPAAGWATTNLVITPLSAQGKLTVRTTAKAQLSADVVGWFTDDSASTVTAGLVVPTNVRVLDTRTTGHRLDAAYRHDQDLTAAVPTSGVAAAFVVATAIAPDDGGSLSIYPADTPRPYDPSVAVQGAGLTSSSPLLVQVGEGSRLSLTSEQNTDLTLDVSAYVLGVAAPADPTVPPLPPTSTGTPEATPALDGIISDFLASRGLAGASLAIAKDGRVVYARAFGSMDAKSGAPVRVDTRFRFASVSKVITAAAVLELVQAGGLSLDEPVLTVLGNRIQVTANPDPRLGRITVRDLLRHTSGFTTKPDPFFPEQPGVVAAFGPGGPKSCEQAAKWFLNTKALVSDPGKVFQYVNMNYCLLGLIVEEVTHEQYDKVVQSLVLERRHVLDARLGNSFDRRSDEVAYPAANGTFLESLNGAGGWLGTAIDLVRFIDGLDPSKPGNHLLNADMYQQMITPGLGSWGLGVDVFDPGEWGHTGTLSNARAEVVHQADGVTWALVVNGTVDVHQGILRDLMHRALASPPTWPVYDYSPELP